MPDLNQIVAKSSVLQNARPTTGPFSGFCLLPSRMEFDVQHSDEHLLLILRQHFVVNTGWILLTLGLLLLPLLLGFFPLPIIIPPAVRAILLSIWYLIVVAYAFERFVVWYYNVYIITDERLIDVDFYSLLFKRVSEAKLDHVQDITASSGGVVQSLFDYGDVLIQTAAEIPEIEFEKVPHPDLVTKLISELIDKEETEHTGKN